MIDNGIKEKKMQPLDSQNEPFKNIISLMSKIEQEKGKILQNYIYLEKNILGKGLLGSVYLCQPLKQIQNSFLGQSCQKLALKLIQKSNINSSYRRRLIDNEVKTLQQLRGFKSIIQLYQSFQNEKQFCLIFELCERGNLREIVKKGAVRWETAITFMKQIVEGFLQLVKMKIIHRDLKPSNILLNKKQQIKIADFGFAIFSSDLNLENDKYVGSPHYSPPEVIKYFSYSHKADIWALGMIFYELLFGKRPWTANNQKELLYRIEKEPIDSLIPQSIQSNIRKFLIKTIQPKPQKRASPTELLTLLEGFEGPNQRKLTDNRIGEITVALISLIEFCRLKLALINIINEESGERQNNKMNIFNSLTIFNLKNYLTSSTQQMLQRIQTLAFLQPTDRDAYEKSNDYYQVIINVKNKLKKNFSFEKLNNTKQKNSIINEALIEGYNNLHEQSPYIMLIFYDHLLMIKWMQNLLEQSGYERFQKQSQINEVYKSLKYLQISRAEDKIKISDLKQLEERLMKLNILK